MVVNKKALFFSSLLLLSIAYNLEAFSLKSLTPYALLDATLTKQYGSEDASEWYQKKTREFLGYFGIAVADQVPVYQVLRYRSSFLTSDIDVISGITIGHGIWLNEKVLDNVSEEARLWGIAYQAAYYKLGYGTRSFILNNVLSTTIAVLSIAWFGATMLAFRWLSHRSIHLSKHYDLYQKIIFVLTGINFVRGSVNFALEEKNEANGFQSIEVEEADLLTAQMLCDYGYATVVEAHLKDVNDAVVSGVIVLNNYNHPSLQEQRAYLKEFWNKWLASHPEYKSETVAKNQQKSPSGQIYLPKKYN